MRETKSFPFHVGEHVKALDAQTQAVETFEFPPMKPIVEAQIKRVRRVSRTPAQMAALFRDRQFRLAVFGDGIQMFFAQLDKLEHARVKDNSQRKST